jgi:hypothetical protein
MSQEPNECWTPQPRFSLDPFFETRDHANRWDTHELWSDDEPKQNDKSSASSAEPADR